MDHRFVDFLFVVAGIIVVAYSTGLAFTTFMIPGAPPPLINRGVLRITQLIFDVLVTGVRSEERRHRLLSLFAPISLLMVLATILLMLWVGYTLTFYGVGVKPWVMALLFSGSALSTLGTESLGNNFPVIMLSMIEALTALTVVAILVGYVPTIFNNYQERERAVRNLDALTGPHPDGVRIVEAYVDAFGGGQLGDLWKTWLDWFAQLATARSTLSGDLYLRSSRWDRSWIVSAGAMLDAAALTYACLDLTTDPAADQLVNFGSHALHETLAPLNLYCPDSPQWPATPINVTRAEFDQAYNHFQSKGLPVKTDRDAAWQVFAQLRVQYECPLMAIIRLKRLPHAARWTSDRSDAARRLPLPVIGKRSASTSVETRKG
jgi:hypothetical protein